MEANVLTGTCGVLRSSEMTKWIVAYAKDAKLRAAIEDLHQGRKSEYKLTPTGLLTMKTVGKEKIVVPITMNQDVLRECHDMPAVGHVGICRTLDLVNRQFHWRGR